MYFILGIALLIVAVVLLVSRIKNTQTTASILIFVAIVIIISSVIKIVPAGTAGVVDLFGKVNENERKPGLNIVNPFARLVIMNVKTEEMTEIMPVPSREGLSIDVDVSILYRLAPDKASDIYSKVGRNYREIVVKPQFRSVSRGATVGYDAKALYTSGREEISKTIYNDLKGMLEKRGVILEKVLLRSIKLPKTVSTAIEMKLKAEQEAEQMKFVLLKEEKEAERRIIEAKGISESQEIINKTLTPAYLQHEAIQAQMQMSNSPNHTTVYIPSGDNGIPLIRILPENK
jgi:regulator of protease activity HflC (stomatin/prohibitin superfamily)